MTSYGRGNSVDKEQISTYHMIPQLSMQASSSIPGVFCQKLKDEIDARLKGIDDEFDSNLVIASDTVNKSVDFPSAQRLAKRLYELDGFKSTDVIRHLCKRNAFNQLVAEEYVRLFNFQGDTLDCALRKFVKQFAIMGEAQDRERVLHFFAARYLDCNPTTFASVDACHMLTCAIMLLNADLHGDKTINKMTFQQFSDNLHGINDGQNFSKDLLKSLYNAIKSEQLENDEILDSIGQKHLRRDRYSAFHDCYNVVNLSLKASDIRTSTEQMQGYIMRKRCIESNGKRTSFLRRGWKTYYATIRDMALRLHENDQRITSITTRTRTSDTNVIRLHHAYAQPANDYRKRPYVFRIRTCDYAEYLFQTNDQEQMNKWIDTINLIAASFSCPSLPTPIDSMASNFRRPPLPSAQTHYSVFEQYDFIVHQINGLEKQLNDLKVIVYANNTIRSDCKQIKARDKIDNYDKIQYLQHELQRYETYADRLRRHFQELKIDYSPLKMNLNKHYQSNNYAKYSSVLSSDDEYCPSSVIVSKQSLQSTNMPLMNPNRYSYMMAVSTNPLTMKERRI